MLTNIMTPVSQMTQDNIQISRPIYSSGLDRVGQGWSAIWSWSQEHWAQGRNTPLIGRRFSFSADCRIFGSWEETGELAGSSPRYEENLQISIQSNSNPSSGSNQESWSCETAILCTAQINQVGLFKKNVKNPTLAHFWRNPVCTFDHFEWTWYFWFL